MADIKLPKTPLVPLFMDHDCRKELDALIRARDLEVANMVLKAAAKGCENVGELLRGNATPTPNETAAFIRNLKVSHD